jgi:hypothetical protein
MNIIEINSLKRTGHHAFTNWLISNLHGVKYQEELSKWKYNHIFGSQTILWINEGEIDIKKHPSYIENHIGSIDTLIITYEGVSKEMNNHPIYSITQENKNNNWNIQNHHQITFIRDFYNTMSSLSKSSNIQWFLDHGWDFSKPGPFGDMMYQTYKKLLRDYLENDNGILYDKWVSNEEYANEICLKLTGKPNQYHPLEIGGSPSSFDNRELTLDKILNRSETGNIPTWLMKRVVGDNEIQEMLNKALYK